MARQSLSRAVLAVGVAAAAGGLVIIGPVRALAAPPVAQTFSYTGAAQTYTIPAGASALDVTITGAGGGGTTAGVGAVVVARISLSGADGGTIQVMVGGQGRSVTTGPASGSAGWNGGGAAGAVQQTLTVGGGGGASDLRIGACAATLSCSTSARVVVAGGGGGSGYNTNYANGGGAYGWSGAAGGQSSPYYIAGGGGGGTPSAAGSGGAPTDRSLPSGTAQPGSAGSGATGGNGGACSGCTAPGGSAAVDSAGGGGGGGYYGGGGGGAGYSNTNKSFSYSGGGGGAGSSWVRSDRTVGTAAVAGAGGPADGSITIAVAGPPAPAVDTPAVDGADSVGLSWTAPQGGADSYRVYSSTTQGGTYTAVASGSCAGTVTATSCSAAGLTAGQAYWFQVSAVLSANEGTGSTPVGAVTAIEAPDAPATPAAAVSASKAIDVTWVSGGSTAKPVVSYTVSMSVDGGAYSAVASGGCSGAATSPCTVSGLTADSTYTFKITATNAAGATDSAASTGVVAQAGPAAPAIGPVTVSGPSALQVAWTPGAQSGVTYTIEQSTSPTGTFTAVAAGSCAGSPAASPCTVTGLTAGTGYSFRITGANGILVGDPSAGSALVTAIDAPAQPGTPVLTVAGDRALQVAWTSSMPAAAPIDAFDVQVSAAGGAYTGVATGACHNPTASHCVLSGLATGTAYTVKVIPHNAAGAGPVSSPSGPVTAVQAPEAPTIGSATPGDGEVTVTFTPGAPNGTVSGYTVSTVSGGSFHCDALPTERACTVTGLTNATEYGFAVVAHGGLDSAASATLTATPSQAPGTPTVTVTAGVASITVQWTPGSPGSGIDGWAVEAQPGSIGCDVSPSTYSCVLGATANRAYTVKVRAVGLYGRDSSDGTAGPATPTLPLIPATPPGANASLTTSQGSISTAAAGQQITFVGHGFAPNSSVRLTAYSTPTVLSEAVADAAGTVTVTVTLPASLAAGAHTIAALGVQADGTAYNLTLPIAVTAASQDLAVTGAAVSTMLLAGLSLMLAGGALIGIGRPRRRFTTG